MRKREAPPQSRVKSLREGLGSKGVVTLGPAAAQGPSLGLGTFTEGPSLDGTGGDVADRVAGPAGVRGNLVPRPPERPEDGAFMGCINAVFPGYPGVGHVQACILYRAYQGHITGTFFPRDLKVHCHVRL